MIEPSVKDIMKMLPRNEELKVRHYKEGRLQYVTSQNAVTGKFTLFAYADGKLQKAARGDNPLILEDQNADLQK